jgi:hypothetical protein
MRITVIQVRKLEQLSDPSLVPFAIEEGKIYASLTKNS